MKIKIETNCNEDIEKVKYYTSMFCKENFRQAKIFINDKLEYEFDWRAEEEK
jgi:hypothetical protein